MFYILIFLLLLKTINSKSYLVELSANKWSDGKSHLKKLEEDFDKRLAENEKEGALKEFPEESRATKDYMSIQEAENLGCKGTILQSSYYLCAGWQKLRGSTGGTRRKVLPRTKILSPNICYFVAN